MRKIEVTISDQIKLDAGTIEEPQDYFLVRPPTVPMVEQLITQLDALPPCEGDFQIQHLGVAFTALCVRWGSYLGTLMDLDTELHPAIPGFHKTQPQEYSFISVSTSRSVTTCTIWFRCCENVRTSGSPSCSGKPMRICQCRTNAFPRMFAKQR
jgi:hypothetical protein